MYQVTIHKSISNDRIIGALDLLLRNTAQPGFCICCGVDVEDVELDAVACKCRSCGEYGVCSTDQLCRMTTWGPSDRRNIVGDLFVFAEARPGGSQD
jgi:hypothetical protein